MFTSLVVEGKPATPNYIGGRRHGPAPRRKRTPDNFQQRIKFISYILETTTLIEKQFRIQRANASAQTSQTKRTPSTSRAAPSGVSSTACILKQ